MKQQGISLVELLISLCLSSLLISMLVQHYLHCKQQYVSSERLLTQALDVQLVTEIMRDSVRRAGFTPCISLDYLTTLDRRNGQSLFAINIGPQKTPGVTIQRMSEYFATIVQQVSSNQLLIAANTHHFAAQQTILVADCFHAEVHVIERVAQQQGNQLLTLKQPLAFRYQLPMYVGEWLTERFFIKSNPQGLPALFYQTNRAEELTTQISRLDVQQIEQGLIQITLGIEQGNVVLNTRIRAL